MVPPSPLQLNKGKQQQCTGGKGGLAWLIQAHPPLPFDTLVTGISQSTGPSQTTCSPVDWSPNQLIPPVNWSIQSPVPHPSIGTPLFSSSMYFLRMHSTHSRSERRRREGQRMAQRFPSLSIGLSSHLNYYCWSCQHVILTHMFTFVSISPPLPCKLSYSYSK